MAGEIPIILDHARKRMKERRISMEQVLQTFNNPDDSRATYPNAKNGATRKKHFRSFGGRKLQIVVESSAVPVIITVAWKE
jgi:uncharacterized protein DUF4258